MPNLVGDATLARNVRADACREHRKGSVQLARQSVDATAHRLRTRRYEQLSPRTVRLLLSGIHGLIDASKSQGVFRGVFNPGQTTWEPNSRKPCDIANHTCRICAFQRVSGRYAYLCHI